MFGRKGRNKDESKTIEIMSYRNLKLIHEIDDEQEGGFGLRDEVEEAYEEGCRHGFEKALKKLKKLGYRVPPELTQGMGERTMPRDMGVDDEDDDMGERGDYGQRGRGYSGEGMGERHRRRSDGRYM